MLFGTSLLQYLNPVPNLLGLKNYGANRRVCWINHSLDMEGGG